MVTKPFSPRELIARVGAILKRYGAPLAAETVEDLPALRFGAVELDRSQRHVTVDGTPVTLTAIEFDILATLLARPKIVFTREQILQNAYRDNIHVSDPHHRQPHPQHPRQAWNRWMRRCHRDRARRRIPAWALPGREWKRRMILSRTFRDKWRPPLSLVVAGVLGIMLLVPLAGVAFFRVYENQLIETTEAELIGQSAAIAAAMAQRLEEIGGADLPLGPKLRRLRRCPQSQHLSAEPGRKLDAATSGTRSDTHECVLPGRGAPRPAAEPPLLEYLSAGQAVDRILQETQKKTLAGFRVLDFNGVIIAGREDIGLSLAHVEEIKRALSGHYASALRERIVDNPQPIYSISRGTSVRVFVAMPIIVSDRVAGVVYASRTPSNILKEMFVKREAVFWVVVFVLAATFVVGFIFARASPDQSRH